MPDQSDQRVCDCAHERRDLGAGVVDVVDELLEAVGLAQSLCPLGEVGGSVDQPVAERGIQRLERHPHLSETVRHIADRGGQLLHAAGSLGLDERDELGPRGTSQRLSRVAKDAAASLAERAHQRLDAGGCGVQGVQGVRQAREPASSRRVADITEDRAQLLEARHEGLSLGGELAHRLLSRMDVRGGGLEVGLLDGLHRVADTLRGGEQRQCAGRREAELSGKASDGSDADAADGDQAGTDGSGDTAEDGEPT